MSVYVDTDAIKILSYPDLLIRLLLTILEGVPGVRRRWWQRWQKKRPAEAAIEELRKLLDLAETSDVTEENRRTKSSNMGVGGDAGLPAGVGLKYNLGAAADHSTGRTSTFRERKLDVLERHFQDYKDALVDAFKRGGWKHGAVIIDDFYLIHSSVQPDVADYIHRLLRGTDLYFKIGTVRHRTTLVRSAGQTIGVEEYQDIEEINLDRTFEDTVETRSYLESMLDSMGERVGIEGASSQYLSEDGRLSLTLASGGVPRDYLTIFVEAVANANAAGKEKWLTPTSVYKGAGRVSYRTKVTNLRTEAGADASPLERVFQDLLTFCLKEKRKTAFLVSQTEVTELADEHELIQQLMDFKLIHIIESDTSAASGRSGRFEAYTLDFALFMEPRLRGIEHVEFWRVDDQRRRQGVREAPTYELARAHGVVAGSSKKATEDVFAELEAEFGTDEDQGDAAG